VENAKSETGEGHQRTLTLIYVTDTHSLIWYSQSNTGRLSKLARSLFEDAEEGRVLIHIPTVVLWEMAQQAAEGTFSFHQRFDHWCRALDSKRGFQIQPLLWEDVNEARALPFDDPFDGLIAGTALRLDAPLITKDAALSKSGLLEIAW
jgi:PIN domain nuclease of toxin-antitoxin system